MTYSDAKVEAARLDAELRADDKRLNGSVLAVHRDGSVLLFDGAFAQTIGVGDFTYAIILTEHHGPHVYPMADLKILRAFGARRAIRNLKAKR